ncbi:MAG: hypothetical protein KGI25_08085 [Thaumarchaeota archaeon]|nr:hypothetical protein [Nitrososphaerota archaeon]
MKMLFVTGLPLSALTDLPFMPVSLQPLVPLGQEIPDKAVTATSQVITNTIGTVPIVQKLRVPFKQIQVAKIPWNRD